MLKDIKNKREYRQKMNDIVLKSNNKNIKRFFALNLKKS
jgi:hypothetical protein